MENKVAQATTSGDSAWARAFAILYDPFVWVGERAGLRAHRNALLSLARGCTLEIGSGTGLNLPHFRDDLDELVLAEPDAAMRARLQKRLRHSSRQTRLIDAPAERLPLPDGSVDTVVSTLVLCTVDAPDIALREIARVLRPGGQLLFLEHVRSESPTLARWQDRLGRAVVSLRTRRSLQPCHRGPDRGVRTGARTDTHGIIARNAAGSATADRGPGDCSLPLSLVGSAIPDPSRPAAQAAACIANQ